MFNGKCVRRWHGRLGSAFEDTQAVETQSIDIKHLWRFTFYIYRYWLILTKTGTSHELYGVLNHWRFDCLLIILIRLRAKKASALCITGPLWGTTCSGGFPHKANNGENVSMSWRHHVRHFSWRCNDTSIVFVMIGSDSEWPVLYVPSRHHLPLLPFNDTQIFFQEDTFDDVTCDGWLCSFLS